MNLLVQKRWLRGVNGLLSLSCQVRKQRAQGNAKWLSCRCRRRPEKYQASLVTRLASTFPLNARPRASSVTLLAIALPFDEYSHGHSFAYVTAGRSRCVSRIQLFSCSLKHIFPFHLSVDNWSNRSRRALRHSRSVISR